jgi:hypothetical protein
VNPALQYDSSVVGKLRNTAAIVLIVAVAFAPALLDRCFAKCAAQRAALASTPACHHATTSDARIRHVPPPCGDDHGGDTALAIKSAAPNPASVAFIAVMKAPVVSTSARTARLSEQPPPGSSQVLSARSLPLRI